LERFLPYGTLRLGLAYLDGERRGHNLQRAVHYTREHAQRDTYRDLSSGYYQIRRGNDHHPGYPTPNHHHDLAAQRHR
jgi:hypothetical protein